MNKPPWDRFASAIEARLRVLNRHGVVVDLHPDRIFAFARSVRVRIRSAKGSTEPSRGEISVEDIIESVLDANEPFESDAERHGYKIAVGIEIMRRVSALRQMIRELEKTQPFSPR